MAVADIDNQPQEDLDGASAARRIHEIGKGMRTCLFFTRVGSYPPDMRPMAIQKVQEDGSVWFLSSSESEKNDDILRDPRVLLAFQDDEKSTYMHLAGRARIHTDRPTIEQYWTAFANNWFDGKDDPRVTVISVHPERGHYWTTQSGKIVQMAKMMLGAVTGGAVADDGGVDGELRV